MLYEVITKIGSDIIVPLDIPTPPDVHFRRAEEELAVTAERLEAARKFIQGEQLLAGPVQGATYPELRERAASHLRDLNFEVYPLGAVVPLMESYRYAELVDVIAASKKGLSPTSPVHLFGAVITSYSIHYTKLYEYRELSLSY